MKKAKTKSPAKAKTAAAGKSKPAKAKPAARAATAKKPATKAAPKPKSAAKAPAKTSAKAAKPAPAKKKIDTKPAKPAAKAPAKAAPAKAAAAKAGHAKPAAAAKPAAPAKPMAVSAPPSRPLPQPMRPAALETKPVPNVNKVVSLKPVPAKVKVDFAAGDYVVYPTHGVGKILRIERQMIAGFELDLMVVEFERDKMTVRVPLSKVASVGIRKLSSPQKMRTALETLKGRARIKRAMWSRRAQEYEAKINSGDPVSIAEVVRDLHRNAGQPDQSYSERQIYESALDRLMRELAAVERIDEESATKKLEKILKAA
ncbi:MAG TPA: CarD family transcriptional regulator [Ferrovibrio sp.]